MALCSGLVLSASEPVAAVSYLTYKDSHASAYAWYRSSTGWQVNGGKVSPNVARPYSAQTIRQLDPYGTQSVWYSTSGFGELTYGHSTTIGFSRCMSAYSGSMTCYLRRP